MNNTDNYENNISKMRMPGRDRRADSNDEAEAEILEEVLEVAEEELTVPEETEVAAEEAKASIEEQRFQKKRQKRFFIVRMCLKKILCLLRQDFAVR